jgi:quinol monooxygenase YgiN
MSILTQFRVTVPDTGRFRKATENMPEFQREPGFESYPGAYTSESDPNEVTELERWQSHDHMHAAMEKYGDQFNAEAGTEGLDWETRIWERIAGEDLQPVEAGRVLVQFRVTVPDVERFRTAWEKLAPQAQEAGSRNNSLWRAEGESNEVTMFAEWANHDEMHEFSERGGEEFQAEAGTEGLDWETRIWHRLV